MVKQLYSNKNKTKQNKKTKKTHRCVLAINTEMVTMDFPGGSDGKASAYNKGDPGSIPGLGRSLEKEMATPSSILAWKIPWMEEPVRLQSMGLQRIRHD